MSEKKPLTPSPFGPRGYLTPEESARVRSERANKFADSILSAIRGAAKAVTTDLPGFVMDVADKVAGTTKSFGEKDRSEQMFSAVTGTSKKDETAELVGSFMNPITAVQAMIVPAALVKSAKTVQEANRALRAGESAVEIEKATGIFQLPSNIDDGILRTILDPRSAYIKSVNEGTRPLEDVWNFPELYNAVPGLHRTPVTFDYSIDGAYMTPWDRNAITIGQTDSISNTVAHEVQHAIQSLFRMNSGSSPEAFIQDRERLQSFKDLVNTMYTEATIAGSFDVGAELIPIDKMLRGMQRQATANYMRTAGEVEARAVELIRSSDPGPLRPALDYYKLTLPDSDLSKLIQRPGEKKVDVGIEWNKLVSTLADLQQKIDLEKSR